MTTSKPLRQSKSRISAVFLGIPATISKKGYPCSPIDLAPNVDALESVHLFSGGGKVLIANIRYMLYY